MHDKNFDSDRTWELPKRSHAIRMSWHDLLFAHWQYEPALVSQYLPEGVTLDTFEGKAWVAVVPFRMSDVAPRFVPAIGWMSAFPELNVRTYVQIDEKPGVWFFSLDATNPIAVRGARTFFHLKYMDADMSIELKDGWYHYSSVRTHRGEPKANFKGKYQPVGEPFFAKAGTLEHWLTARYCLYTCNPQGGLLRGEIDHPPWTLQQARWEVQENSMLEPLSLATDDNPHLLFSKDIAVRGWTNDRVR